MATGFRCTRTDLGCSATYATTAELDDHTRMAHGYYKVDRLLASFSRPRRVEVASLNVSPHDTASPRDTAAVTTPEAVTPTGVSPAAVTGATRHRSRTGGAPAVAPAGGAGSGRAIRDGGAETAPRDGARENPVPVDPGQEGSPAAVLDADPARAAGTRTARR